MKEQLMAAWHTHQQMNLLLFDHTTDAGMGKTLSTKGGRTVYLQWVHIQQVRLQWLEICAMDIFIKYKALDKSAPFNRKQVRKALEDSAKGMEELFARGWDNDGKIKGFKKGLLPLLGYFIAHEAHHRGNMMLTLKHSGEKIPDIIKWGLWEWGK